MLYIGATHNFGWVEETKLLGLNMNKELSELKVVDSNVRSMHGV